MKYRLSGPRPSPLENSCKKAAYHTREDAEDMISHIKETRVTKDIRPYRCTLCGMWHLTSSNR
ncbi:MAG TPA: hypothetical protein VMT63_04705 [Bacteroidales bacterium]|nr:hypothetical protein [Bacteroidales bacterium]